MAITLIIGYESSLRNSRILKALERARGGFRLISLGEYEAEVQKDCADVIPDLEKEIQVLSAISPQSRDFIKFIELKREDIPGPSQRPSTKVNEDPGRRFSITWHNSGSSKSLQARLSHPDGLDPAIKRVQNNFPGRKLSKDFQPKS